MCVCVCVRVCACLDVLTFPTLAISSINTCMPGVTGLSFISRPRTPLNSVASLLHISEEQLKLALTFSISVTRGERIKRCEEHSRSQQITSVQCLIRDARGGAYRAAF